MILSDRDYINAKLQGHMDEVFQKYPHINGRVFAITANGSMNYDCFDRRVSDVDSHMIIFPDAYDICIANKSFSKVVNLKRGEKCLIKDIRDYCGILTKGNINFLETLVTDFYLTDNEYYEWEFQNLREMADEICRIYPWRTLDAALGMACQAKKTYDNGRNPKELATVVRLNDFVTKFTQDGKYSFYDCIHVKVEAKDIIMSCKVGSWDDNYSEEYTSNLIDSHIEDMKFKIDEWKSTHYDCMSSGSEVMLKSWLLKVFRNYMKGKF